MSDKPNILDKAKNLIESAAAVAKDLSNGTPVKAQEQTVADRLAICSTCPHFKKNTCELCGCHMKFKTKLSSARCPIHKW